MSDIQGKRSQPCGEETGEFGNKDFSKKRDQKENNRAGETRSKNGSAVKGKLDAGDYSLFPIVTERTVQILRGKGYRNLFPIQQACIGPIFDRHDVIARDLTGSGKTMAFGIGIIEYLRKNNFLKTGKLQAIMLAPTRELALQITNELSKLKHSPEEFRIVTVYGGVSVQNQANALKSGADLFVGTTGRVLDHMERGNIDFSDVKTVILDEADVMLKLGFKEDVEKILKQCKDECTRDLQICLFSATIPDWIKGIAQEHMKNDFRVIDLAKDLTVRTAKHINHLAIDCPFHERLDALSKVLSFYGGTGRIIVFTSTKADANSLLLSDKISHDCEAMHGDIVQNQREVTMKRFREGKFQVLVATDVASRGLDIPEVELVVQLDPPKDTESYIHRSGRTARAGRSGTCITFYNDRSREFVDRIEDMAGVKLERVGVPNDQDMIKANTKGILKKLLDVEMEVLPMFEDTADLLINQHGGDASKALQIALAYCSGHYKMSNPDESLMTGRHQMTTIKMCVGEDGGSIRAQAAFAILFKYWAPRISESVKYVRPFSDGQGVVFDIRAQWVEAFLENFEHLKQGDKKVDFNVSRAKTLPDCGPDEQKMDRAPREENGEGGQRRGGYDDQNGDDRRGGGGGGYGGSGGGGGGGRSYGDRGDRDRGDKPDRRGGNDRGNNYDQNGGGGDGGNQGGWSGGGQAWNKGPSFNTDYQKPKRESYNYDSSQGGSTAYSSGNQFSAPSTPNPYSQNNRTQKYNDFESKDKPQQSFGSSSSSNPVIYLTNMSFETNEQDIMSYLKSFDYNPIRAKLLFNPEGRSKGTGFVQMASSQEAQDCIAKLSNQIFAGRKLIINEANQQRPSASQGYSC